MRLKSYFVHTMEEAMRMAKGELGDDAMLVDAKRLETPPGGRVRMEVIFAAAAPIPPPPKVDLLPAPTKAASFAALQQFRGELTALLDALSSKPDTKRLESLTPARSLLESLRARLIASEVPPVAADEMLVCFRPVLEGFVLRGGEDVSEVSASLLPLLAAEWSHLPKKGKNSAQTLAFVGPSGAGKSSALAKLAFRLWVSQGIPVNVISLDSMRIGAADQLAHLCSLLGVPFRAVDYAAALPATVASTSQRGVTLIDTPGYGPGDKDSREEAAKFVRQVEGIEIHLVLPATLRFSELCLRQQQYGSFVPTRLLFTRLDETEFFGSSWAFARHSRLPIHWVSTGPAIPEDLEIADVALFAEAILGISVPLNKHVLNPSHLASAAHAGGSRI